MCRSGSEAPRRPPAPPGRGASWRTRCPWCPQRSRPHRVRDRAASWVTRPRASTRWRTRRAAHLPPCQQDVRTARSGRNGSIAVSRATRAIGQEQVLGRPHARAGLKFTHPYPEVGKPHAQGLVGPHRLQLPPGQGQAPTRRVWSRRCGRSRTVTTGRPPRAGFGLEPGRLRPPGHGRPGGRSRGPTDHGPQAAGLVRSTSCPRRRTRTGARSASVTTTSPHRPGRRAPMLGSPRILAPWTLAA